MDRVENLEWNSGEWTVRWRCGGTRIEKTYDGEVASAIVLRDGSGVAIVEPFRQHDGMNAVVVNADGSERFRVSPPQPSRHVSFREMYYVRDDLAAIAITRGNDWAALLDAESGRQIRMYETR